MQLDDCDWLESGRELDVAAARGQRLVALPDEAVAVADDVKRDDGNFALQLVTVELEQDDLPRRPAHHERLAQRAQRDLLDAEARVVAVRVKGANLWGTEVTSSTGTGHREDGDNEGGAGLKRGVS